MTEPLYKQPSMDECMNVVGRVAPLLTDFLNTIPDEDKGMYASGIVTLGIAIMCVNADYEAVKLFLERAIADLPDIQKTASKHDHMKAH